MPVRPLNRRRFLGYSAAAGLALSQGSAGEVSAACEPLQIGVIGLGNRGTALLRALVALPDVRITVICDLDARACQRAAGIVEKGGAARPATFEAFGRCLAHQPLDAAVVALPCDQHAHVYERVLDAGKHLYGEKPLALTLAECDHLAHRWQANRALAFHVGLQRRHNARLCDAVARLQRGDVGELVECRCSWSSTQGPMEGKGGWLGRRARSGDWMLEQAVHVWDTLCWIKGEPPASAYGVGRRHLFAARDPGRDVTDWYLAHLTWDDGSFATLRHSWIDLPAGDRGGLSMRFLGTDGEIDLAEGTVTYRDKSRPRETLFDSDRSDTQEALRHFIRAARDPGLAEASSLQSLSDATRATQVGLLVRRAVDERRWLAWADAGGLAP